MAGNYEEIIAQEETKIEVMHVYKSVFVSYRGNKRPCFTSH